MIALTTITTIEKDNDTIAYNIFAVIRTKNEAIAKNIVSHLHDQNDFCKGHATILATYPIEDVTELVKEVKIMTLDFAGEVIKEKTYQINDAVFVMQIPIDFNKNDLLQKMKEETREESILPKTIIKKIFDLENITETINAPSIEEIINLPIKESPKPEQTLKINEEKQLIKKYGKRNLNKLAKKMNYTGTIINNQKNHVK
jgi:hypothetical protein